MFKFRSNFLRFILLLSFVVAFGAPWSFFNEARAVKRPDFMISNKFRKSDEFDETNKYALVLFSLRVHPGIPNPDWKGQPSVLIKWNQFDSKTTQLINVKRDEKDEFQAFFDWKSIRKERLKPEDRQWHLVRVIPGDFVLAETRTTSITNFGMTRMINTNVRAFSQGTEGFRTERGKIYYIGDYYISSSGG